MIASNLMMMKNYLRHFSDSMATSEILTRATLPRGERNGEREEGMLFPEVCFWVNHMNLTNTLFLSLMPNMESDCLKRCRLLFSPTIDQVHRKTSLWETFSSRTHKRSTRVSSVVQIQLVWEAMCRKSVSISHTINDAKTIDCDP